PVDKLSDRDCVGVPDLPLKAPDSVLGLPDGVLCLSHLTTEVVRVGVPSSDPAPSTGDRTAGVTVTESSRAGAVAFPEGPAIRPGRSAGVRLTSHTRRSLDTSEKRPERTKGSSKDLVYLAESLGQKTHGQDEGKCTRGHLQEFCKDFLVLRVSVQPEIGRAHV